MVRDYSKGKIYKVEGIGAPEADPIYVGATTKELLSQRMVAHRSDYKKWRAGTQHYITVFDLFERYGVDNCRIVLLENCPCETIDELSARELEYIRRHNCVNKVQPSRTPQQYYTEHKEHIAEWHKQYYQANAAEQKAAAKQNYWDNREAKLEYQRQYAEKHADEIKQKAYAQDECACGAHYQHHHKARHLKSKRHLTWVANSSQQ